MLDGASHRMSNYLAFGAPFHHCSREIALHFCFTQSKAPGQREQALAGIHCDAAYLKPLNLCRGNRLRSRALPASAMGVLHTSVVTQ